MQGVTSDAWLIGAASAASLTDGNSPDLGGWQPGDSGTAQQRCDDLGCGGGLSTTLAQYPDTASQVAGGYLTGLARALVDGAQSGLGASAIGASLTAYLSDPANAHTAALGLLATGIAAAALAVYLNRKVRQVRWLVDPSSNVCPVCAANAAGSPYPIASAPDCPAHNRCRCQRAPA